MSALGRVVVRIFLVGVGVFVGIAAAHFLGTVGVFAAVAVCVLGLWWMEATKA